MGRSRQSMVVGVATLVALCIAVPSAAASELVIPHPASPQLVTPHVLAPPSSEAQDGSAPAPTLSVAEPPPSAGVSPQAAPVVGQEGPSSGPEEPGSSYPNECPGPECNRCPGSPKCPDAYGQYSGEGFSSLSDDPRYAACAGSQFLMLLAWPDNVMEDQWVGFLLPGLRITGGLDHPKYPPHPGAYPNWTTPPPAYDHLAEMVKNWNRACINFVSP